MEEEKKTEQENIVEEKQAETPAGFGTSKEEENLTLTQAIALQKHAPTEIEKENFKEGESYDAAIEAKRLEYVKVDKKNRITSLIMMGVVVALLIVAFILMSQNNQALKIVGYVLIGLAIVGLLGYYIFNRRKNPDMSKGYITEVTDLLNSHIFNNQEYTNMKCDRLRKEEKIDVMADRLYKDVVNVASRNVCTGEFAKHSFKYSEMAVYGVGDKKRNKLLFLGRYITTSNDLKFDGRIIFTLKQNDTPVDVPNDIDGMSSEEILTDCFVYKDSDTIDVYKILPKEFIKKIADIKLNESLLGFSIVLWAGRVAIYLSYEDSVNMVPVEHPLNPKGLDILTDNVRYVLKACELLRK